MPAKLKIRENLHKIIDQVEDEKILKAVYVLLEKEIVNNIDYELTVEQQAELDRRIAKHESGESKSYSWEEVKQKIRSGL